MHGKNSYNLYDYIVTVEFLFNKKLSRIINNYDFWGILFPDAPDSFKLSLKIKY